jgi:acetolactate synthase-1/2/3 large subunit
VILSDWIFKYLEEQGVHHVFTLCGGFSMYLNNSLANSKIMPVYLLHEQSCAFAAEAYSQLTGLGVCLVTSGPGATNAVTGCAAAWNNYSPVLFISGQVKTNDLKQWGQRFNGAQEVDIISMVKHITKYAEMITKPAMAKAMVVRAISEATHGEKAPVWLDIPLNIQSAEIPL